LIENNEIKVEEIDSNTMYKMIQSLLRYDYYSTKCLVELFIEKRKDAKEKEVLNKIRSLLFEYKIEEVLKILEDKTK